MTLTQLSLVDTTSQRGRDRSLRDIERKLNEVIILLITDGSLFELLRIVGRDPDLTAAQYLLNNARFNVKDNGAVGDGSANDTAAFLRTAAQLNAAGGGTFYIPHGNYNVAGVVITPAYARVEMEGGWLIKNANGPCLTIVGSNIASEGVTVVGDMLGPGGTPTYTGDNIVISGNSGILHNCASFNAYGDGVRVTGNAVKITGSRALYGTANPSTNWDIHIIGGLYHKIIGYESQSHDGGICMEDSGSQLISGCQFGKLFIKKVDGTTAGANGGMIAENRIVGAINVQWANTLFIGNQIGRGPVDFEAGTANCVLGLDNLCDVLCEYLNHGNIATNVMLRNVGVGSMLRTRYGPDLSSAELWMDTSPGGTGVIGSIKGLAFGPEGRPPIREQNVVTVGWNPGGGAPISNGARVTLPITVPNLALGDAAAEVSCNRYLNGCNLWWYVTPVDLSGNNGMLVLDNFTGGPVTIPAGGTFTAVARRY
jgi:hypothetical protein